MLVAALKLINDTDLLCEMEEAHLSWIVDPDLGAPKVKLTQPYKIVIAHIEDGYECRSNKWIPYMKDDPESVWIPRTLILFGDVASDDMSELYKGWVEFDDTINEELDVTPAKKGGLLH